MHNGVLDRKMRTRSSLRHRRLIRRVGAASLILLAVYYTARMTVWPLGVAPSDLVAYNVSSHVTESTSPSGHIVRHVLNNAGAGHSGPHFVWVLYRRHPCLPWRVCVSGWSGFTAAPNAIHWIDGETFSVWLFDSRHHGRARERVVRLGAGCQK